MPGLFLMLLRLFSPAVRVIAVETFSLVDEVLQVDTSPHVDGSSTISLILEDTAGPGGIRRQALSEVRRIAR